MINLLFNCVTPPKEAPLLMNTTAKIVEIVLFETNPGYSDEEVTKALSSLNDVIKLYYGFIERTTASNGEGKYVDIIYWSDIESAKNAANDIAKNEKAAQAFTVIKQESVQMFHFDTFNQFIE